MAEYLPSVFESLKRILRTLGMRNSTVSWVSRRRYKVFTQLYSVLFVRVFLIQMEKGI